MFILEDKKRSLLLQEKMEQKRSFFVYPGAHRSVSCFTIKFGMGLMCVQSIKAPKDNRDWELPLGGSLFLD